MTSERLHALAEGLGFSEPSGRSPLSEPDRSLSTVPAPQAGAVVTDAQPDVEPEHATGLRMNVRYFVRSSMQRYGYALEVACGKEVHYFKQECWISPFKLDLKGWYWNVPTMAPGHAPSGPLPDRKDCAELARRHLLAAGP